MEQNIFTLDEALNILKCVRDQLPDQKKDSIYFTTAELKLITTLLCQKDGAAILRALVEYLESQKAPALLFSASQVRKLKFMHHYINVNSNGAEAARIAGFSKKTSKQQSYRLRKEIEFLLKVNPSRTETI